MRIYIDIQQFDSFSYHLTSKAPEKGLETAVAENKLALISATGERFFVMVKRLRLHG